ncbi:MAG TPA: DNA topoisomerase IB [Burkholderiales bacterium]
MSDASPGIERRDNGRAVRYFASDGSAIRDETTLARIRKLAIPPAWTRVWICPREDGHLQATGRDARGRKQYRYHPRWREVRDESKYARLLAFGHALPRIRRRVQRDLARPALPREKVIATVVRLLERTFIRVGNEEYARANDSFGLTTLRERQVTVKGAKLRFKFRGKSGVHHEVEVSDRRIAGIVRRMQELPGEELFQYVDESGATRSIESADVNEYLKSIAGEEFTSKDFRTWAGTLLCARALCALPPPASPAAGRREVAQAVEGVARQLRNTQAVCRKCYIHPGVISCYMEGRLQAAMSGRSDEAALIALLRAEQRREASRRSSLVPVLKRSLKRINGRHRLPRLRERELLGTRHSSRSNPCAKPLPS